MWAVSDVIWAMGKGKKPRMPRMVAKNCLSLDLNPNTRANRGLALSPPPHRRCATRGTIFASLPGASAPWALTACRPARALASGRGAKMVAEGRRCGGGESAVLPQSQVLLRIFVSFVADLRFQNHHAQTFVPFVAAFGIQ